MEEQISQITQDIWSSFLGLEVGPGGVNEIDRRDRTLTAAVQISGAWEGAVALECPTALATSVAAAMLGLDASEIGAEDTQDALGELANITGGNVKALLPGPCKLSLPAVAEGADYSMRISGLELTSEVPFQCQDMPFVVRLYNRASEKRGSPK